MSIYRATKGKIKGGVSLATLGVIYSSRRYITEVVLSAYSFIKVVVRRLFAHGTV